MTRPIRVDGAGAECPRGFLASGMHAGVKANGKPDLALLLCPGGASLAGMFTRNLLRAAPVEVSAQHLRASLGRCRAVLVNSGCANAATGADGLARALRTADALAARLRAPRDHIQVASTGLIGSTLPDAVIVRAIPALVDAASPGGLPDAARAILTTDLAPKAAQARVEHGGRTLHVAGIAKGSGMIHPDMATMLVYILTDASAEPETLDRVLRRAVERSFHRITVDGDTSTNDSVLLLASGEAGEFPEGLLEAAVAAVARELAMKVVADGEGARKRIHVRCRGAADPEMALRVARTVASSLLVRTAIAGGDPNWGRVIAAVGRADPRIAMAPLVARAAGRVFFERGAPTPDARDLLRGVFTSPRIELDIDLAQGDAEDEFFSCDLTEDYVRINASYST